MAPIGWWGPKIAPTASVVVWLNDLEHNITCSSVDVVTTLVSAIQLDLSYYEIYPAYMAISLPIYNQYLLIGKNMYLLIGKSSNVVVHTY